MAFEYSFKLNNDTLLATLGSTVVDKLEEPLDEGGLHIPISVFGYQYKMLGLLEIEATDIENNIVENFTYLIINDKVKTVSKDGFYSHDLRALEYTHKLDKYLIHTLTFTKPFERKVRAPFTYNEETPMTISYNRVEIPQYFYVGKRIRIPLIGPAFLPDGAIKNAYISTNATGMEALEPFSFSDADITFLQKGNYEIYIGYFNDGLTNPLPPTYTYFVNVVDEVRYTLYDMLMRVRAITPIENEMYFEQTRLFDIDVELEDYFKQIEMPQMFLQQMTTRQVLNLMFKYINSISRLVYIDGGIDKLTIDEFNKITGYFDEGGIVDYNSSLSAQQYGSKAISWLSQTLQSDFRNNPSVKSPAQDRYKTVRSTSVQMTDSNFQIEVEKEIYELSKIEVVIPKIEMKWLNGGLTRKTFVKEDFVLDITARTIEKSIWELKQPTVDFPNYIVIDKCANNVGLRLNKSANIFWERGKKTIDTATQTGAFFKSTILMNMIKEAINEDFTIAPHEYGVEVLLDYAMSTLTITPLVDTNETNLFRNLKFNIEYIALEEPILQVDRTDISENVYYGEVRLNTQSKFTDYGRASRDAYGQLQRTAVPSKEFSMIHTNLRNLLNVGMIDNDGYIITERSLSFYNDHVEAEYVATLDHNRLNEFVGIDQEYRVFENPLFSNVYKRKDFYNDYLIVTNPNNTTLTNQVTLFTPTFAERMFYRLYVRDTTPRKITFAFVRTDGMLDHYPDGTDIFYITTPVISFGGKGALGFTFGFDHNQKAGDALKKVGANYYNDPIKYTDEFGFFDKLYFQLVDKYIYDGIYDFDTIFTDEKHANQEHKYPLFRVPSNLVQTTNFLIGTGNPYFQNSTQNIVVYKDASSTYSFTYQISVLALNHNEYVFGQSFFTDNTMVNNPQTTKSGVDTLNLSSRMFLYRYTNEAIKYNKFDDLRVKQGYSNMVELTTSNVINTSTVLSFVDLIDTNVHKAWAIGDEDGNLYIACNYAYNGFKKYRTHFRPNLLEIGNK